jgi:hypothetical protein
MSAATGWQQLIPPVDLFRGAGRFPLDAYSEFLPSPRLGWKPYANEPPDPQLLRPDDPWGWYVTEFQEQRELRPGLEQIAKHVVEKLRHLLDGTASPGLKHAMADNLAWPADLAEHAGNLTHDHCVVLAPLALSRTQDDKGRLRWTFFGNSEQGPAKPFWKSFQAAPQQSGPALDGPEFLRRLLRTVFRVAIDAPTDLHAAGLRILPLGEPVENFWAEGELPAWAQPLVLAEQAPLNGVRYLLTFRPFSRLPDAVRAAYLAGKLQLLPTPASLIFWGSPRSLHLHEELPLGLQIYMLLMTTRRRDTTGFLVPQSGVMHDPKNPPKHAHHELTRNQFKRTHRWDKVLREADELVHLHRPDHPLIDVLFSSFPDDCGLYDKPMVRNVQIWTLDGHLVLDGAPATTEEIHKAYERIKTGGEFGYRLHYPAMRVGAHVVFWQRPMAAFYCPQTHEPKVLHDAPLGYLTAYATVPQADRTDPEMAARGAYRVPRSSLEKPVELWPRLLDRPLPRAILANAHEGGKALICVRNVRKLIDAHCLRDHQPLPRAFARELVTLAHGETLEAWLASLPTQVGEQVSALIAPQDEPLPRKRGAKVPDSLTYDRTAKRAFEVNYWKTIAALAESPWLNKNNADVILDDTTKHVLTYPEGRHLDDLAEHLLAYYAKKIAASKLDSADAGSLPFQWKTDLDFCWMDGWCKNRERPAERNLLVRIPGKDRSRAVIMADHYDTAYEADRYEKGVRIAASGADDNHSATAALMLAAPIFLDLSAKGQLGCDIWLVHLTGEEFPADCLGARHLCQALVQGTLQLHLAGEKIVDLSGVQVKALYVSDMIAHNNDHDRDIFQIAPGSSRASLWCAEQAQIATRIWNESVPVWNQKAERKDRSRSRRSPHGAAIPEVARHLALNGQVRPPADLRSTLFNTDGQVFSDVGLPTVLFMENYDINRSGYHDTHDTMENIDLDYGAALAAIVIETVARAATEEMPVISQR